MFYRFNNKALLAFYLNIPVFPHDQFSFLFSLSFIILIIYISFVHYMFFSCYIVSISLIIITLFTTIAIFSPKFSLCFVTAISCLFLFLSFTYEIFSGFYVKQREFFCQLLIFLGKTSILDFLVSVYILFFCVKITILVRRFIYISIILIFFIIALFCYSLI